MKYLVFAAFLILLVLPGCGNPLVKAVAGGDVTDAVIKRAESFSDRALEELEAAEAFLREKAVRVARAKCRFPYSALVRYGCKSEADKKSVEDDCGLVLTCNSGTTVRPPPVPVAAPGDAPGGEPR